MEHSTSVIGGILASLVSRWKIRPPKARGGLPLLLEPPHPASVEDMAAVERVLKVMGDVAAQLLEHLHHVNKHLRFWQNRAQGSELDKVKFMVLERGPWAFAQGVTQLLRAYLWATSPTLELVSEAAKRISERVTMLTDLCNRLAALIGQVYIAVDKMVQKVSKGRSSHALAECVVAVLEAVAILEGAYDLPKSDYHSPGNVLSSTQIVLEFDGLSEKLMRGFEWTNSEINDALDLLLGSMWKLENFLSNLMSYYRRPRKVVRHWIQYSGGAVGIGLASSWLVRHSRLGGSDDLDRWLKEAGTGTLSFLDEHVRQPLLSIRDELFETFHKRHRSAAELGDVQLTSDSLQPIVGIWKLGNKGSSHKHLWVVVRMMVEFVTETKGEEVASKASEQELMEMMMSRYEQELTHPVKNLVGGELARALLIQVQKLKLDIETAMLELNQILRANEINFAILAALPAFFFAITLGWLLQRPFTEGKGAEGRGREAQTMRRMLMVDVDKAVMTCQMASDEGLEEDAVMDFGMLIYYLDRLYKAVKRPAKLTDEWSSLQQDIVDLAKPRMSTYYKLAIAARMERVYDCLAPIPKV